MRLNGRLWMTVTMAAVSGSLFAFQWPVDDKILTATFGESRWDHYHTGIDIGGGSQEVRPIDEGEVIFFFDGATVDSVPPSGLGSFVVVEHARAIRSVYAHLEPGNLRDLEPEVDSDTVIGRIGDSGASIGKHLHLEVIDSELASYVNPLLLLPTLADTVFPEIVDISLVAASDQISDAGESPNGHSRTRSQEAVRGGGERETMDERSADPAALDPEESKTAAALTTEQESRASPRDEPGGVSAPLRLTQGLTIGAGEYYLLVELFDRSEHVAYFCPMAPFRVTGFINGSEAFQIELSELVESSGTLVTGGPSTASNGATQGLRFDSFYYHDWIVNAGRIPFRVGEIQLEVVAEDIVGNETTHRVALSVE